MTGCSSTKKNTGNGCFFLSDLPEHGQDSKIVEFKRIAIMDTVTAVINGEIFSSAGKIDNQEILLTNKQNAYKVLSDSTGHFTFYHIQSGTYKLEVNVRLHRELKCDTLRVGTGDILNLIIAMGSMGKDDNPKH